MTPFEVEELFVLVLVGAGYVPVIRAYAGNRESFLLFAGYSALLVGRLATVLEDIAFPTVLATVEHVVGVALAGLLFFGHFYYLAGSTPSGDHRPSERLAALAGRDGDGIAENADGDGGGS
jgi:hypothetical protein